MSTVASPSPTSPHGQALQRLRARILKHPSEGHTLDEAAVLSYQIGDVPAAVDYAQRATAVLPNDALVFDHLCLFLLAADRPAEAAQAGRRATTLAPREGAFWINLGNAQLAANEAGAASVSLGKATELIPREPLAWYNRGNALARIGKPEDALRAHLHTLKLSPGFIPARESMALILKGLKRYAEAAALLAPVAQNLPPPLLHLLGKLSLDAGNPAEALPALQSAQLALPDDVDLLFDLIRCLLRLDRKREAAPLCTTLTQLRSTDATVWHLSGICSASTEEAIAHFRRALELRPAYPDATVDLAQRLVGEDRDSEALQVLDLALLHTPDHAELHCHRGVALMGLNRIREALAANERALACQPGHANARWNRALCRLRLGDYAEGWKDYDWRWKHEGHELPHFEKLSPWPADNPRNGHLLVWTEQGVGDEVMFATLLPALLPLVDRITVTCSPRLHTLFSRSFPGIEFIAQSPGNKGPDADIAADWQLPIGSLPARLWRPAGHPGRGSPTLVPDPDLSARLRTRYRIDQRPVVGLAWRTSNSKTGRERTIAPEVWAPTLRRLPVRFVSLQYGDCAAELGTAAAAGLEIIADTEVDQMQDLDAFAAQIAALDAVLTIDNSTVHFAGALGVPTWLLVPTPADWRWCVEGSSTAWYQTVRIHRRETGAAWAPIVAEAADAIGQWLHHQCPTATEAP